METPWRNPRLRNELFRFECGSQGKHRGHRKRYGYGLMRTVAMVVCVCGVPTSSLPAQGPGGATENPLKVSAPEKEDLTPASAKVDVKPLARDEEIRTRLQSVLDATGWFTDPQVRVEEGVVFLIGTYIVLRVSGLTQLALTVVGGTGLKPASSRTRLGRSSR